MRILQALLGAAAAAALTGCNTLGAVNQAVLAQGRPVAMFTLPDCAGWVVQAGLPMPVGQRMEALDQICLALMRKPEPPAAAASAAKP